MHPAPLRTTDYHTAGEPFRIVEEVPVTIPGRTVAERRVAAAADPEVQRLRQILCYEPRGHADMYGGFIVPPDDDGADLGVLFWHKDGFSTACGHGTIALGVWAVQTGRVTAPADGAVDVVIDVPSGRVTARVHLEASRVVSVGFRNVPSYVLARDLVVPTSRGDVRATLSYGGAIYANVDASDLGLTVTPENLAELITVGREVKWALNDHEAAQHPDDPRLSGVYGTILFEEAGPSDFEEAGPSDFEEAGPTDFEEAGPTDGPDVHQRNVTVFADGEVDRSPCGSGTCARVAVLAADGRLAPGARLVHDSVVGSTFVARVLGTVDAGGRPAVLPEVSGMGYRTGEHTFHVDPHDPLVPGFVLR
ncbi:proline racemase family protein [Streptomyces sp. RCU064]|uniref:Proline racemase family protein n=1 Tax=Streptomyces rugosispiralis TaxID=2967341 RepID=A0ABT1UNP5_9ACTN|nr:proline racemase family protein [Streptomyces rugosispiralis]MCQ8186755.1 proline racemase family protein [Streptomyces rugosispiralis]